jgi:peptidoglycan-N-acetylglucosamine deacetylase
MFTFRNTTILFFLVLLLLNILQLTGHTVHFGWYLLDIGVYLSVSVAASFFIASGFHAKAVCRVKTEEKIIALTFDDGPDAINTPQILDILKDNTSATFFIIGKNIDGNEELIRRMDKEGHVVGTHSFYHGNLFDMQPARKMREEFRMTEEKLVTILGKRPLFFRPPYGVINPMVKNALKSFPYHIIGFSNRSFDTTSADGEKILRRVTKNLKPGDIVLFHDTLPVTVSILQKFITFAKNNGYRIVPLETLTGRRAYEEQNQ